MLQLASNKDETLIFAATESGPFVYVVEEDEWHDLSGQYAPAQTYWSVEYLDDQKVARFGTYGRGIWDFEVSDFITSDDDQHTASKLINVFPNPAQDYITAEGAQNDETYTIIDLQGKVVVSGKLNSAKRIDIKSLINGTYILRTKQSQSIFIKQ